MSDDHTFEATVQWPADPAQKLPPDPDVLAQRRARQPRPCGRSPAPRRTVFGGDASRYNPEELVTMALAHCHMLTYLALAAKKQVAVLAYEDHATRRARQGSRPRAR